MKTTKLKIGDRVTCGKTLLRLCGGQNIIFLLSEETSLVYGQTVAVCDLKNINIGDINMGNISRLGFGFPLYYTENGLPVITDGDLSER
jgi:hypothetical protein